MHEPRYKQGMGMGYAVSPTGADHMQSIHDTGLEKHPGWLLRLGVLQGLPANDLGPGKVRMFIYQQHWNSFGNCAGLCVFLPYSFNQQAEIVQAITGWDVTTWELMKVGERGTTMARAFNAREGFAKADDNLPKRIHQPFPTGPIAGIGIGEERLSEAISIYYDMMGWDRETGVPARGKLQELDIEWVADIIGS